MTRSFEMPSLGFLAGAAATGSLASIGFAYLLFGSISLPIASFTVPVGAVALTAVMILVGSQQTEEAPTNRRRGPVKLDAATGLANPVIAEQFLATEFAAAQRGRTMSVVTIRITDFDRLAAQEGSTERVLVPVSRVLRRCTRAMNLTAHDDSNPGTFISVLSDVDTSGACVFVQRVRKELAAIQVADRPLTVSAGVAGYDFTMRQPVDLVRSSRAALERAARDGGSRVVLAAGGGTRVPGLSRI